MTENQIFNITDESQSVQAHISILQNIVQRMAANSSSCKSWSITLASAILVIVADKGKPDFAWIAMLPTIVFAFLDAYYLALEKGFRETYNNFVKKLHSQELQPTDLYVIQPSGNTACHQFSALKSISVWGFYLPLVLLICITKIIVIG